MDMLAKVLAGIGLDADDCKVLATIGVVVLLVVLVVIVLAGAAGIAVAVFEALAGI